MDINNFSEHIGDLVRSNKVQEAIEEMSTFLKATPHLNQLIVQSTNYTELKRQIQLGIINFEDAQVAKNKILLALLDLVDQVTSFSAQDSQAATEANHALAKMFSSEPAIRVNQKHYGKGDNIAGDKIVNN